MNSPGGSKRISKMLVGAGSSISLSVSLARIRIHSQAYEERNDDTITFMLICL